MTSRGFGPGVDGRQSWHDNWLIAKFDSAGNYLWAKYLGLGGADDAWCAYATRDSGFVIVGSSESYGAVGHVLLTKFDAQANYVWGTVIGADNGYSVVQTSEHGYAVSAHFNSFTQQDATNSPIDLVGLHADPYYFHSTQEDHLC